MVARQGEDNSVCGLSWLALQLRNINGSDTCMRVSIVYTLTVIEFLATVDCYGICLFGFVRTTDIQRIRDIRHKIWSRCTWFPSLSTAPRKNPDNFRFRQGWLVHGALSALTWNQTYLSGKDIYKCLKIDSNSTLDNENSKYEHVACCLYYTRITYSLRTLDMLRKHLMCT